MTADGVMTDDEGRTLAPPHPAPNATAGCRVKPPRRPGRSRIDGAVVRRQLIASGVLVEGTGERLGRIVAKPADRWRLDTAAHESAAVEIWCCERERAEELAGTGRRFARISPVLQRELSTQLMFELTGRPPVTFTPREQWLRDAMAPDPVSQPEALASS